MTGISVFLDGNVKEPEWVVLESFWVSARAFVTPMIWG